MEIAFKKFTYEILSNTKENPKEWLRMPSAYPALSLTWLESWINFIEACANNYTALE